MCVCVCVRKWCLIILLQVHGIQLFEYFQDIDFGRVWKFAQSEPVQQGTFVKILQVTTTCTINASEKRAKSPKLERPCPPKLISMHFTSTSTCMNFLSRFYFLTPMDYSPWFERKFWLFLKANKKEPNLQNRRGYTHQNWFPCISCEPLFA